MSLFRILINCFLQISSMERFVSSLKNNKALEGILTGQGKTKTVLSHTINVFRGYDMTRNIMTIGKRVKIDNSNDSSRNDIYTKSKTYLTGRIIAKDIYNPISRNKLFLIKLDIGHYLSDTDIFCSIIAADKSNMVLIKEEQ